MKNKALFEIYEHKGNAGIRFEVDEPDYLAFCIQFWKKHFPQNERRWNGRVWLIPDHRLHLALIICDRLELAIKIDVVPLQQKFDF